MNAIKIFISNVRLIFDDLGWFLAAAKSREPRSKSARDEQAHPEGDPR